MNMQKTLITCVYAAAVAMVWSWASWYLIPWHHATLQKFSNEGAVLNVVMEAAQISGAYMAPAEEKDAKEFAFVFVNKRGLQQPPLREMAFGFLTYFLASLLICFLLSMTKKLSEQKVLTFVTTIGLLAGILCHVPQWIWLATTIPHLLVGIADNLITWFLAGIIIAKTR